MKKLLLLTLLSSLFIACSDDDNKSLNGSIWEHTHEEPTWKCYKKVTFRESTYSYEGYEITLYSNDTIHSSNTGSYVYSHPNVILTEKGEAVTAIISGNTMTTQTEGEIVYVRK